MIKNKILVVGLGNPILSDDGVGWVVAQELEKAFSHPSVDFICLSLGGLSLMEKLEGYKHVVIIDAIMTMDGKPGSIYQMPLSELPNFHEGHTASVHDTSLQNAIEMGEMYGLLLPTDVYIVAVECLNVNDFSEDLTPDVAKAVPETIEIVRNWLETKIG